MKKVQNAISGEIYVHKPTQNDTGWIIVYKSHSGKGVEGFHGIVDDDDSGYMANEKNGYFNYGTDLYEATDRQINWLRQCILAGKKVPYVAPMVENYEIY